MKSYTELVKQSLPKILCVGKNYLKHVKQMGGEKIPESPVIFLKTWSTLNLNPKNLYLQSAFNHRIDHQVQLGVFIKKGGSNIKVQEARQHIGGYFLAIDITDRDFQSIAKQKGLPWALSKSQHNFCPISDLISQQINPYQIQLELSINGQLRQKDNTKQMHFKINQIISYCSKFFHLNDGDLILTGTPDGVGPIKPGDRLQAIAKQEDKILAKLDFIVDKDINPKL